MIHTYFLYYERSEWIERQIITIVFNLIERDILERSAMAYLTFPCFFHIFFSDFKVKYHFKCLLRPFNLKSERKMRKKENCLLNHNSKQNAVMTMKQQACNPSDRQHVDIWPADRV